jgi:hypothetical protein
VKEKLNILMTIIFHSLTYFQDHQWAMSIRISRVYHQAFQVIICLRHMEICRHPLSEVLDRLLKVLWVLLLFLNIRQCLALQGHNFHQGQYLHHLCQVFILPQICLVILATIIMEILLPKGHPFLHSISQW